MQRRILLIGALFAAMGARLGHSDENMTSHVAAGAMTFDWTHRDGRLHGRLTAPAPGWLAVGFNELRGLTGTRFVMAAVASSGAVTAQERFTVRPGTHSEVGALGGRRTLADLAGRIDGPTTTLDFSLLHAAGDTMAADLRPGAQTHLMLAWSHAPEFTHHSAWRRHFDVVL